jgi:hypothetical protein
VAVTSGLHDPTAIMPHAKPAIPTTSILDFGSLNTGVRRLRTASRLDPAYAKPRPAKCYKSL